MAIKWQFTLSRTGVSPSDAVWCHIQDTPFIGGTCPFARDTVGIF